MLKAVALNRDARPKPHEGALRPREVGWAPTEEVRE